MRKKLHSVTAFDVILAIIMVLICFACVYPMWYILANSLAAPEIANRGPVAWWPKALSLDAYKVVFQNELLLPHLRTSFSPPWSPTACPGRT